MKFMKKKKTIENIQKKLNTLKGIPILRWDCEDKKLKYFDTATKDGDKATIFIEDLILEIKKWIKYFNMLGDYFKDINKERSDRHYSQAVVLEMFLDLESEWKKR